MPVLTTSSTSPGRSMNDCPAVSLVASHWLPTDRFLVSSRCFMSRSHPLDASASRRSRRGRP